jgi:two-component system, OmpR family, phosphate regulon response regulator PhoB
MSTTPSKKILVADDEADVLNLVCNSLKAAGYQTIAVQDGNSALEQAKRQPPSLLILDLMMPGMSGLDVCKILKADPSTKSIPIIMLTAKAEEVDRILGFELGADDYLTKPFSPRELSLRVQSVLRRVDGSSVPAEVVQHGDIVLDHTRHEVKLRGKSIDLTATEFKLLATLMERRGRVQSRDVLLNDVWGYESAIDTRTVDTHVRRLREKLGSIADCIETIRGFGYRMIG